MGRKKKRKYETYEDYDEDDSCVEEEYYDDEENEDEYEEDGDGEEAPEYSGTSFSARSLGKRKKRGKLRSSFVRPAAKRSVSRQTSYGMSRRNAQNRRGPHFAMKSNRVSSKYVNFRKTDSSIFAAWGKLLLLISVLAAGTWLAFYLSAGRENHPNSAQENHSQQRDSSRSGGQDRNKIPEIVQKTKKVTFHIKSQDDFPLFF